MLEPLVVSLKREMAAQKNMSIEWALAAPAMSAAPALLAIALRNLIDNALRYGADGGCVRVESSYLSDGGVRIAVRDDGPGVPYEQHRRLVERFFRILGTEQTGSGLGLSIVERIVALHGAKLHFEGGLRGRGLSVVMDFPAH